MKMVAIYIYGRAAAACLDDEASANPAPLSADPAPRRRPNFRFWGHTCSDSLLPFVLRVLRIVHEKFISLQHRLQRIQ